MTRSFRLASAALVALGVSACSSGSGPTGGPGGPGGPGNGNTGPLVLTPKSMLELRQQQSCAAFQSYVVDSIADQLVNLGSIACPGCEVGILARGAVPASLAGADATGVAAVSFDAFTETNNQEAGVDELDEIETDAAGHFYFLDGGALIVANGLPPDDLRQIARLPLDTDGWYDGLILDPDNDRLVIVGSSGRFFGPVAAILPPLPWRQVVDLVFVDVSNPAAPVVDRRMKVEGYKLAVRRIGDRMHLVSHFTPVIPASITADPTLTTLRLDLASARQAGGEISGIVGSIHARVAALVAAADVEDFLPDVTGQTGNAPPVDLSAASCADTAVPGVSFALALTSVTSLDTDGDDVATLTIVNNSWNVYASQSNLYLTQSSGGWWFSDRQSQQTAIYKIGVGDGAPVYSALGSVRGWAFSSMQMSEHEGRFRIVTNRTEFDPATNVLMRGNDLNVLEDDGAGSLNVIGSVEGFGADEQIFSARFLGDRAFVVTFRQIDPLFAFDLSVPADPRLVGEVEIPGVSTYIHPLDEAHLLTIGFDGNEERLTGGFALQIFDVQNLDDPRLIHKYTPDDDVPGFAWTSAIYDHHAFNYFDEAGTLTIPLQYYAAALGDHFSGFAAYGVDVATGFTELGRLDHSDLARIEHCDPAPGPVPAFCASGAYLQAAYPRRSVSANFNGGTYIYTLSNVGMKVSDAADFGNPVAVLPLPDGNSYPWWPVLETD